MVDRPRLRRPGSRWTRGVVACALLLALVACGPPEIDAPDLSGADAAACRALVADLPTTLLDQERVETTGDTEYGAAWGDPAIVLTCGVGAVDLDDAPPCTVVDGVGWVVPDDGGGKTTFVTDGYRPRVQVVVPDDYAPEADALTELATVVTDHTTLEDRCVW